ncbi:glycosyltransferase family 2 protein [Pseudomonas subflava]|uniref:glycosyltransferase family 2 protein n=1 Tax=Pseudomonas subflava TaxID=2952933 RepID=UPI00207AF191|nr:glycosyltransferase family 2 protein [Pseudomonas subflava]
MADKLISVVIPTYNYASVLPRAVGSVMAQLSDADAELLVIDDGSTDNTRQVIAELRDLYGDRFTALHRENGGLASVRNHGIAASRGQYLVFLDADDEMLPGALAALSLHISQQPHTRMVIAGHHSVAFDGRKFEHPVGQLPATPDARLIAYLFDKTLSLCNGACAMHREVFSAGVYPERIRNAEDIPVFAQVLARFPCTVLNAPMAAIYKHPTSLRRNLDYARQTGVELVDEVFSERRMPADHQHLRRRYHAQRCLSLFRLFSTAERNAEAMKFFRDALKADPRVLLRWTYTRKALRILLGLRSRRRPS